MYIKGGSREFSSLLWVLCFLIQDLCFLIHGLLYLYLGVACISAEHASQIAQKVPEGAGTNI